jgi:predicted DNA-binding antitoxin AbrB/MazE fold protein
MAFTVEAVYENGVLKPAQPLALKEGEKVSVTIRTGETPLLRAYGIMGWEGSAEDAERFARDADLDYPAPAEGP